MEDAALCFLATSKSGLGHLRRAATIAASVRRLAPSRRLHLVSNAPPEGLSAADLAAFDGVQVLDRARMAADLTVAGPKVLVLDTITVPGVEALGVPLALVLREAPEAELSRFRLAGGRPWDLALIANPAAHWMPSDVLQAQRTEAVGWIYRAVGGAKPTAAARPHVLVATGGGGTADTARDLYAAIDALLAAVRPTAPPFEVVQAVGPRARAFGVLAGADRVIDPGSRLNEQFHAADVVISTAGYNSVLELALTDTPTLLVPIRRSIDDQAARARLWAGRLGMWLDPDAETEAAAWLSDQITARQRRLPVDLGPSGEDRAAEAILALA